MKQKEKRISSRMRWERFRKGKFYEILYEKGILYFVLSFLIPFSILWYAFGSYGIHPFGDRQILVVDLWHQYYPFFRVVREKLINGGSFFYSWENGLGTNFLSLISYYAASPLNWLSVFFDDDHVRDAMTFILSCKIGFAGAFFSTFLRYTYKRKDFSICMFSVMYALCSYTLGYYWNVMWFDTVALFPLVMLGIVALCREGKWKVFTLALMLSLVANYYIGYFTCIFSVFMFASASIIECKGIKDWFRKLLLMIRSSIIGVGLGGFMLLPAYFGLKLTYSANNTMPRDISFYEDWRKIFAHLLSYDAPTKVDGLPNFACGMLAVLLFGVFLFSFGIKIREKISSLLMLALIAVSCNMNILNFIWHGFHFTNQIPYRFAFIFSFVLAAAAFRAYDIILSRGIKIYQLVLMVIAPVAVVVLNYYAAGKKFEFDGALRSSIIITGAFWLIFIAAKIFPFKTPKMRNAMMTLALAAAVFSEFVSNAQIG
ncbi:MAG: YfhO family protein, partial [Ruminococcus sp.]|nr:YfhO family protein [Ruminococcus sp.]